MCVARVQTYPFRIRVWIPREWIAYLWMMLLVSRITTQLKRKAGLQGLRRLFSRCPGMDSRRPRLVSSDRSGTHAHLLVEEGFLGGGEWTRHCTNVSAKNQISPKHGNGKKGVGSRLSVRGASVLATSDKQPPVRTDGAPGEARQVGGMAQKAQCDKSPTGPRPSFKAWYHLLPSI